MSEARDMSASVPGGQPDIADVLIPAAVTEQPLLQECEQADWVARGLRLGADASSLLRGAGGVVLGYNIAKGDQPARGWRRAGAFALLAATDWLDGHLARAAHGRDGIKTSHGGWNDQLNDKVFITSVAVGVAVASAKKDPLLSKVAATSAGITMARDLAVTTKRIQAERQGLDTDAKKSGKGKMLAQIVALGLATTPLARHEPVRRAVLAGIAGSTALAVSSGVEYIYSYNRELRRRRPARRSLFRVTED